MIIKKRKGSTLLGVISVLVIAATILMLLTRIDKFEREVKLDTINYMQKYQFESYADLVIMDIIEKLSLVKITYPKDLLNDNIYLYEKALTYVPSQSYDGNLLEKLSTTGNSNITKLIDAYVILEIEDFELGCDYSNEDNTLYYSDDDVLYLEPINIKLTLGKPITIYEYQVNNVYLTVSHSQTEFTITINTDEAYIT